MDVFKVKRLTMDVQRGSIGVSSATRGSSVSGELRTPASSDTQINVSLNCDLLNHGAYMLGYAVSIPLRAQPIRGIRTRRKLCGQFIFSR